MGKVIPPPSTCTAGAARQLLFFFSTRWDCARSPCSLFAVEYVNGLQGDDHYLAAVATCKHTLLYDLEHGRDTNSLHATDRDMTDYFLVPYVAFGGPSPLLSYKIILIWAACDACVCRMPGSQQ